MIIDQLVHWQRHFSPEDASGFAEGFRYLEQFDLHTPDGRYPLRGEAVFAMVQTLTLKPRSQARLETHRQYADIQYVLEGEEDLLWCPREGLLPDGPYEPDLQFHQLPPETGTLHVSPGWFAVFLPQDAHAPGLCATPPATARKIVVKVRLAP